MAALDMQWPWSPSSSDQAAVRAVYAAFVANGFAFASWAARIPQVSDQLLLAPPGWGWCCSPRGRLRARPAAVGAGHRQVRLAPHGESARCRWLRAGRGRRRASWSVWSRS